MDITGLIHLNTNRTLEIGFGMEWNGKILKNEGWLNTFLLNHLRKIKGAGWGRPVYDCSDTV